MAAQQTWIASTQYGLQAADRDLLSVFNYASSDRVIRIYRMIMNVWTASTVPSRMKVVRNSSSIQAGTATVATLSTVGTGNVPLSAYTSAGFQRTVVTAAILRQVSVHPSGGATLYTTGAFYTVMPYSVLWDAGYSDENIQPLTCPIGYDCGYGLLGGVSGDCYINPEIEFTSEAS